MPILREEQRKEQTTIVGVQAVHRPFAIIGIVLQTLRQRILLGNYSAEGGWGQIVA